MKKLLAVAGMLMLPVLLCADGNYTPALVTSTNTFAGYLYPANSTAIPATTGGVLVGNGSLFNWSNTTVTATTTATSQQILALTSLTSSQIEGASGIIPAATGQIVMCSNCQSTFLCLSTGSANSYQWIAASSSTVQGKQVCN
jgi:hypothetical protein